VEVLIAEVVPHPAARRARQRETADAAREHLRREEHGRFFERDELEEQLHRSRLVEIDHAPVASADRRRAKAAL
jgi:hypothetical protein